MNNSFTKKVYLIIVGITFIVSNSRAQIVYTDVIDTTISRSTNQAGTLTYIFDVNADGTPDYNIAVKALEVNATGCTITPPSQTNLSAWINTMPLYSNLVGDSAGFTASIEYNTIIDSAAYAWSSVQQDYLSYISYSYPQCTWDSTLSGNWINGTTNYIALKFKVGAQIHYGWIHVYFETSMDSANNSTVSVTVFDYAYNTVPGQQILAGETGITSVIDFNRSDNISVFPNPAGNHLTIQKNFPVIAECTIFNSLGKIIYHENLQEINTRIDLEKYPADIYYYRINSENNITTGKIIHE